MSVGELFSVELCPADGGDTAFHFENRPGQLQRPNILEITSSLRSGLVLQADLIGALHGHLEPDGDPATLLRH